MAFDPSEIRNTHGYGVRRLSCLVYGPSGVGKTSLAATTGALKKTLVLSAEAGLLPLRQHRIRYIEITGAAKLFDVLEWLERRGSKGELEGAWVILDSLSEIAERLLRELKTRPSKSGGAPDGRAAYGEVSDTMIDVMKRFRDLPCNTVFLAKMDRIEDGDRRLVCGPMLPGKRLAVAAPYEFDIVMAARVERLGDNIERWLQTEPDGKFDAKDRSGVLAAREPMDLGAIAAKIGASIPAPAEPEQKPASDAIAQEIATTDNQPAADQPQAA